MTGHRRYLMRFFLILSFTGMMTKTGSLGNELSNWQITFICYNKTKTHLNETLHQQSHDSTGRLISRNKSRSQFCGFLPLVPILANRFVSSEQLPLLSSTTHRAASCIPWQLSAPLPKVFSRWSAKAVFFLDVQSISRLPPAQQIETMHVIKHPITGMPHENCNEGCMHTSVCGNDTCTFLDAFFLTRRFNSEIDLATSQAPRASPNSIDGF